jgi:hypothetical protein
LHLAALGVLLSGANPTNPHPIAKSSQPPEEPSAKDPEVEVPVPMSMPMGFGGGVSGTQTVTPEEVAKEIMSKLAGGK